MAPPSLRREALCGQAHGGGGEANKVRQVGWAARTIQTIRCIEAGDMSRKVQGNMEKHNITVVGYCPTCEFFIRGRSELAVIGLRRFGRCRLRVHPITANAMCCRYKPLDMAAGSLYTTPMTLREFSQKGGKARMAALTKAQKSKLGAWGAFVRWQGKPKRGKRRE